MLEPTEKDLLVPFEQENIPRHYKQYYSTKRHNFFASIQQFSDAWNCFVHLDEIWEYEFELMNNLGDPNLMLPMMLFMNGHAKMRIAFELGCSSCLMEGNSILRDAIESVAHGRRISLEPTLHKAWIEKSEGPLSLKTFKEEFEYEKASRVFNGLPELHALWKQFSEFGSHTNLNSIVNRFHIHRTETHLVYSFDYSGAKTEVAVPMLFEMILTFWLMENAIYSVCESRLKLDLKLPEMRSRFEKEKEQVRQHIIQKFNLRRL